MRRGDGGRAASEDEASKDLLDDVRVVDERKHAHLLLAQGGVAED